MWGTVRYCTVVVEVCAARVRNATRGLDEGLAENKVGTRRYDVLYSTFSSEFCS